MKRLIVINLILLLLAYIIPTIEKQIENTEVEQEVQTEVIEQEVVEVSTRGTGEFRTTEKNYTLTATTSLRTLSNLDSEDYEKLLQTTNLKGLGDAYKTAETKYKINGLYLVGLCCLESSYGNSSFAKNRNNLVGWGAYDSNPNKAKYFNSKSECILYVAEKLSENYLTEGACYFSGYTAKDIDKHYCTDKEHANKIINIVNNLERK